MYTPTKECSNSKCQENNPQSIERFAKNRTQGDGFNNQCKSCEKTRNAAYRQTKEGKAAMARGAKKHNRTEKGKKSKRKFVTSTAGKICRARADKKRRNTEEGKAAHAAIQANRRAKKLEATPKWLTKEQKLQIKQFYIDAARLTIETGILHHVDHILPLQGEGIRGLHTPWNLQILAESENAKKNNSFDFTYDNESWRNK